MTRSVRPSTATIVTRSPSARAAGATAFQISPCAATLAGLAGLEARSAHAPRSADHGRQSRCWLADAAPERPDGPERAGLRTSRMRLGGSVAGAARRRERRRAT